MHIRFDKTEPGSGSDDTLPRLPEYHNPATRAAGILEKQGIPLDEGEEETQEERLGE